MRKLRTESRPPLAAVTILFASRFEEQVFGSIGVARRGR
jgi:hypothetical protein